MPVWSLLCVHGWADAAGDVAAVKLQDLQQPKAEPGLVLNRKV